MFELYHEIRHFSSKMREYNQKFIDRDMVLELTDALKLIHRLLSDPVLVKSTEEATDLVKGIQVNADLIYRCQMCKSDVGPFKRMTEHLKLPRHLKECEALAPANGAVAKPRASSLAGSVVSLNAGPTTSKKLSEGTQSLRDHIRTVSVPPSQKVVVQAVSKNDGAKKPVAKVAPKTVKPDVCKENLNKNTKKLLESDICKIVDDRVTTGLNLKFSKAYENIVRDLNQRLADRFPSVKSYCFGSRINGLGTKKADLDIYVDIGNTYQGGTKLSKEKQGEVIDVVLKILAKDRKMWDDFERIKGARTPLLRAFNHQEKIDCDISFTSGLSHCNTYLLQYMLSLQPVCECEI
jgi:Nucleotidyltransferase domain